MASKVKTLKLLKNCLRAEEQALPAYANLLKNPAAQHLPQQEQQKIGDLMSSLMQASEENLNVYRKLIAAVEKVGQNDF